MDAGVRCAQMDVWFWARLVCEECALVWLCFDRPEGLRFVVVVVDCLRVATSTKSSST